MQSKLHPYLALVDIARRAQSRTVDLPGRQEIKPFWNGIGFSLLGHRFVISMEDVVELLEVPQHTFVPGAQPWVVGVANVRGRLLPLIDLAVFFRGQLTAPQQNRRALVVERDKMYAGLIVDELYGMQHLALDYADHAPEDLPESFAPMVNGQFRLPQGRWLVFDIPSLLHDGQFMDAAAS
ncbi:chemotaxis protein CheW [Microbulbifer sp. 2201CG32-9]|uniref:chemotaxis protein CheW n=1 Tax=unclassified Microbulbifer TaxID=2619833 RepID=UPI00345C00D9